MTNTENRCLLSIILTHNKRASGYVSILMEFARKDVNFDESVQRHESLHEFTYAVKVTVLV